MSKNHLHMASVEIERLPEDYYVSVECPRCEAQPGEECRVPSGQTYYAGHNARWSALREQEARTLIRAARWRVTRALGGGSLLEVGT